MSPAEALMAAGSAFVGLAVTVVGWLIVRAVKSVDVKVDTLISKDTLQDIAIGALQTRLSAAQFEIDRIRERITWLTEVTGPLWVNKPPPVTEAPK